MFVKLCLFLMIIFNSVPEQLMSFIENETVLNVKYGAKTNELGMKKYGYYGTDAPYTYAVNSKGEILIFDYIKDRIVKFGKDNKLLDKNYDINYRKKVSQKPFYYNMRFDGYDNLYLWDYINLNIVKISQDKKIVFIKNLSGKVQEKESDRLNFRWVSYKGNFCISYTIEKTFKIGDKYEYETIDILEIYDSNGISIFKVEKKERTTNFWKTTKEEINTKEVVHLIEDIKGNIYVKEYGEKDYIYLYSKKEYDFIPERILSDMRNEKNFKKIKFVGFKIGYLLEIETLLGFDKDNNLYVRVNDSFTAAIKTGDNKWELLRRFQFTKQFKENKLIKFIGFCPVFMIDIHGNIYQIQQYKDHIEIIKYKRRW